MRLFTTSLVGLVGLCAMGCVDTGSQSDGEGDEWLDAKVPGDALGMYAVTGTLGEDTCGADGLGAPSTWEFAVRLSRDGSALYWLNGREAIVGEIDRRGSFGFETHLDLPLQEPHGAAKGCTIVRRDAAQGALDASGDSFEASLSFGYEQTANSDCSEWTSSGHAQAAPQALPCRLDYALRGDRSSPP